MSLSGIVDAFSSSIKHLQTALNKKEDRVLFSRHVWQAFSELEYALFLLSLVYGDDQETPHAKTSSSFKELDIESVLKESLELLEEVKSNIQKETSSAEALRKAWKVREYLLKIQNLLEKQHEKR